jgi:hypothetical protein
MNLWVKRTGQFLMAALFLISCEEDSYLLGFPNKNKKFNVRYQEFILPSTVVLIDSLITDNHDIELINRFLVGQYQDPSFGTVRTESYTQLEPSSTAKLATGATYDSVTLQLKLDYYSYGAEGISNEKFTVHEIIEDSLSFYQRYYYNSSIGYNPTPLAQVSFKVNYDSLQKGSASQDTILVKTKLDDDFGFKLFVLAVFDTDSALEKNEVFRSKIKGLALIPDQSNMIIGFNPTSSLTKVTLHYHTTTDTLQRDFLFNPFNNTSFIKISTNRTGDLAGITQPYEGFAPPSGSRYLQNGSPVITKFDISEYYDFIRGQIDGKDSLEKIAINSAELVIESVETPPDGMPPPSTLIVRIMKGDDLFMNNVLDEDSVAMSGFYLARDGKYFLAGSDLPSSPAQATTLTYDSDKKIYKGFVTLFMQNLFDQKSDETDVLYLGIVPSSPTPGKTLSRAVFDANSVKLKISYTAPKSSNLQ